jgi:ATP-dependent helicase/nuclease subunit A
LLEKLTAGWQEGDARTLFLVGDPMQSIYRFREAEVGLFLKARREGIGGVHLDALTLSVNFRSQAGVVAWVNATFSRIMAAAEDMASGAVSYAASSAHHGPAAGDAVSVHALAAGDRAGEAQRVLDIVRRLRAENAGQKIAILVRTRNHLDAIVPALKDAGLSFRAIEIDPLGERQPVQDLLALTRALVHCGDRTAWLALLRAPWCGLALADLTLLAQDGGRSTLWDAMRDEALAAGLSADGASRVRRVRAVLEPAIDGRRRGTLRNAVEGAWLALGGPACIEAAAGLEDAERYFDFLHESEAAGTLADMGQFEDGVARLYAAPDAQGDEKLQIMTIHKSKGLEFDAVIVPGLARATRRDEPKLMLWMERPRPDGGGADHGGDGELLLAPIRAAGSGRDAIYDYIAGLESARQGHEDVRLLYVAATRARTRLHLLADTPPRQKDDAVELAEPKAGTLLAPLWPAVRDIFSAAMHDGPAPKEIPAVTAARPQASISRLVSGWSAPPPPDAVAIEAPQETAAAGPAEVEFSWASETARHVGTVVHRFLQLIAEDGVASWDPARVAGLGAACERDLAQLGVAREETPQAAARVQAALAATLADARGAWILGAQREARSELRLTGVIDGAIGDSAIDRTFVDADGTRWIIDFKTGVHEGGEVERFLDSEQQRYRAQLERYAALIGRLYPGPVKLGLYFPLLGGWREWSYR